MTTEERIARALHRASCVAMGGTPCPWAQLADRRRVVYLQMAAAAIRELADIEGERQKAIQAIAELPWWERRAAKQNTRSA